MNAQTTLSPSEISTLKTKVQSAAKKSQSITSNFSQTKHLSILDNTVESTGLLKFKAPDLVKWEYTTPFVSIAIFKQGDLLVLNDGKKEQIDLSANKLFKSLNTLIVNSIKGDMFDDAQFDISYFKNDEYYLVSFVPKDKRLKRFIASFELKFTLDTAEVTEVKLLEPNNDFTVIRFTNRMINQPIPDSEFKL